MILLYVANPKIRSSRKSLFGGAAVPTGPAHCTAFKKGSGDRCTAPVKLGTNFCGIHKAKTKGSTRQEQELDTFEKLLRLCSSWAFEIVPFATAVSVLKQRPVSCSSRGRGRCNLTVLVKVLGDQLFGPL